MAHSRIRKGRVGRSVGPMLHLLFPDRPPSQAYEVGKARREVSEVNDCKDQTERKGWSTIGQETTPLGTRAAPIAVYEVNESDLLNHD